MLMHNKIIPSTSVLDWPEITQILSQIRGGALQMGLLPDG